MEQVFDVEQPKEVEQAGRCGTGPERWNRPKEVEQRKDQQYSVLQDNPKLLTPRTQSSTLPPLAQNLKI